MKYYLELGRYDDARDLGWDGDEDSHRARQLSLEVLSEGEPNAAKAAPPPSSTSMRQSESKSYVASQTSSTAVPKADETPEEAAATRLQATLRARNSRQRVEEELDDNLRLRWIVSL